VIGLDTNILVRYLTQDDPLQTPLANQIIDTVIADNDYCYLNVIVLVELVWVLTRAYRYPRLTVIDTLEKILLARHFAIEDKDSAWRALTLMKSSNADFSDCLISVKNQAGGCDETLTFDQKAATLTAVRLLTPA
jgi:predicted nucleic-acid-binding protein